MLDFLPFLPLLYPEIHYTFGGFSLLYRDRPEAVVDAPYRVEPGLPIPLLILVKDAHRFPIRLDPSEAEIRYPDGHIRRVPLIGESTTIDRSWWHRLEWIELEPGFHGTVEIRCPLIIQRGNLRPRTFWTDNLPGTQHKPLRIRVAETPLPRLEGWRFGDLHAHSWMTSDQAEFGPPVQALAAIAQSMGIDFIGVTDHSYDLDDLEYDYLKPDPELAKWRRLKQECGQVESKYGVAMIPGEEVSCGNLRGRNVHMLVLGDDRFHEGSGDSGERWFRTKPELTIEALLGRLDPRSVALAAHPEVNVPFLQKLLLGRGAWSSWDYEHSRLDGLQILNGSDDAGFRQGEAAWTKQLLKGRKTGIAAGNDSHGTFNRYRQLRMPFFSIEELSVHRFGRMRTAVEIPGPPTRDKILEAIRRGRGSVTSGPLLALELLKPDNTHETRLNIKTVSSEEFGSLESIEILTGGKGDDREAKALMWERFDSSFRHECVVNIEASRNYVRGRLLTRHERGSEFCLTHPIWLQPT